MSYESLMTIIQSTTTLEESWGTSYKDKNSFTIHTHLPYI